MRSCDVQVRTAATAALAGVLALGACAPSRGWGAEMAKVREERGSKLEEVEAWRDREDAACAAAPDPVACRAQVQNQYFDKVGKIWTESINKSSRLWKGEAPEGPTSEFPDVR